MFSLVAGIKDPHIRAERRVGVLALCLRRRARWVSRRMVAGPAGRRAVTLSWAAMRLDRNRGGIIGFRGEIPVLAGGRPGRQELARANLTAGRPGGLRPRRSLAWLGCPGRDSFSRLGGST